MKDALDVVMAWQLRNPGDPTNPEAAIEEVRKKRGELTSALAKHFLKLTIRPFFVKNRPATVTASGRKINPDAILPPKITAESMDDSLTKPWKSAKEAVVLDLLKWVVGALDEGLVHEVWPMVVPPILTLVDDWETKYKRLGAELLRQLLDVTPPDLLVRTGLGEVFEQALMPCLSYLPSLSTPDEAEPLELLSAVYPALLSLANARFPPEETTFASGSTNNALSSLIYRQRVKFLDSIVRKGILYDYPLSNQYPRITALLFDQLVLLLNALGIESVKHLKYLLPMLTDTLTQRPLASPSHTPTLLSAIKALQAIILNCWPRIVEYRGEVLKGVTLSWLNLDERSELKEEKAPLRAELKNAVGMLRAAVGDGAKDFDGDCLALIAADGRLEELLKA
jgi:tRNA nucleotidyltransferase (CCA-adding enzyme)